MTINPRIIPGLKDVDDVVSEIWEIDKARLFTRTRKREVVEARMVAMVYRYRTLRLTLQKSAEPYHLDHATVDHALKTVDNLLQTNRGFRTRYDLFTKQIQKIHLT